MKGVRSLSTRRIFFSTDPGCEVTSAAADEELIVVGIGTATDGSLTLLLAREGAYGLEYVGDSSVLLAATPAARFWAEIERLACDYPHLEMAGREARWVRPVLRVRAAWSVKPPVEPVVPFAGSPSVGDASRS